MEWSFKSKNPSTPSKSTMEVDQREVHRLRNDLQALQRSGNLSDVTLVCGSSEFSVHRAILASCSNYFLTMFTSNFAERSMEKIEIYEVESKLFKQLVDYAYTRKITMNKDTVQAILTAANMFLMDGLVETGCYYLESLIHPSNVLGIYAFAQMQHFPRLAYEARKFTKTYFLEIIKHEEFLELDLEDIAELIASSNLTVQKELQVFEAVLVWVKYHPEVRAYFLPSLLRYVRLDLLPGQILHSNVIMRNYLPEEDLIPNMKLGRSSFYANWMGPRTLAGKPQNIIVFCGERLTTTVNILDFVEHEWRAIPPMNIRFRRTRSQAVALHSKLYVLGGFCSRSLRTTQIYDFTLKKWLPGPPMNSRRSSFAVAKYKGRIFVTGGIVNSPVRSAEVLDARGFRWTYMPSMRQPRAYHGIAFLRNVIYAVGGMNSAYSATNTVEYFDVSQNSWVFTTEMNTRRYGAGVAAIDDRLYVIGGSDRFSTLNSVEVFNPDTKKWTEVSPMMKARKMAGVVVLNDRLVVVGGDNNGTANACTVEIYDPTRDLWWLLNTPPLTDYDGVHVSTTTIGKYIC